MPLATNADIASVGGALAGTVRGNDLFNPSDIDNKYGQFVNPTTGALSNGNAFNATGFIQVTPGDQIVGPGPVMANRRAYYDATKVFISGVYDFSASGFTVPNTTSDDKRIAYVRFTVPLLNWDTLKIERAATQTLARSPFTQRAPDDLNLFFLRQTRYRLSLLAGALGGQFNHVAGGDSYTHGASRYITPLTNRQVAKYGDGGGGWCGFGFLSGSGNTAPWTIANQPSFLNGNARPATYPTRHVGSQGSSYYTEQTCDLAAATVAIGEIVYQAFPALPVHNACTLHYVGVSGSSVNVAWGTYTTGSVADPASYTFGSNTNYTTATAGTVVLDISAGITSGAGMLRITGAAGTAKLAGVNLKSAASGYRMHKTAATGSAVTPWATAAATTGYATSFLDLSPHAFTYMDGPNAQGITTGGIDYTTWSNSLGNLMTSTKTISASCDRLFLVPPENPRTTNVYSIAGFEQVARWQAMALRFALSVIRFGDAGNTAEYKSTGAVPLFNVDDLHPEPGTGGAVMAGRVEGILSPTGMG